MAWKTLLRRAPRSSDPSFDRMATQLSNVAVALQACLTWLGTLSADYDRLYSNVASFATDFYSLYPSEDSVRRLGKATVASTDALLASASTPSEASSVHTIERQIRAYLSEIHGLQGEMKKIGVVRSGMERAGARLERADARGGDDSKRGGLVEVLREKQAVYETMLAALTTRLESTYEKHAMVFQAAWTAYVLRLEDGKDLLEKHMKGHRGLAKKLEVDVVRMQLGSVDEEGDEENY